MLPRAVTHVSRARFLNGRARSAQAALRLWHHTLRAYSHRSSTPFAACSSTRHGPAPFSRPANVLFTRYRQTPLNESVDTVLVPELPHSAIAAIPCTIRPMQLHRSSQLQQRRVGHRQNVPGTVRLASSSRRAVRVQAYLTGAAHSSFVAGSGWTSSVSWQIQSVGRAKAVMPLRYGSPRVRTTQEF